MYVEIAAHSITLTGQTFALGVPARMNECYGPSYSDWGTNPLPMVYAAQSGAGNNAVTVYLPSTNTTITGYRASVSVPLGY